MKFVHSLQGIFWTFNKQIFQSFDIFHDVSCIFFHKRDSKNHQWNWALVKLDRAGIIHRDRTPENIILKKVLLGDFGLAEMGLEILEPPVMRLLRFLPLVSMVSVYI